MNTATLPAPPDSSGARHDAEVIGLVGLAHGTSHFYHLLIPPLFPWLMRDFGLSFTEVGALMSVFFVVSGLGQAAAGFVVDRVGARPVLFAGLALLSLSALALGAATSYAGMAIAAAVAGLGNSVFHPSDFTLLNHNVAPPRLGHAFSVHGLVGNLGWAAAPVFMVGIASVASWQIAAFAASGVGALALVVLWLRRACLRDAPRAHPTIGAQSTRHFEFLGSGAVWLCFAFFFLTTMAFGVLQNYSPAIFERVYAMPLALATAGLTAYLLGSAAGMVLGGFLAARTSGNDRLIAVALGVSALVALVLAMGWAGSAAVLPLMAAMGLGVGVAGPNRDLLVRKAAMSRFGKTSFGRVYGFVYSGLDVGLALSPLVIGPLMDAGRFQAALVIVAVLQLAALSTALRVGVGARREGTHSTATGARR